MAQLGRVGMNPRPRHANGIPMVFAGWGAHALSMKVIPELIPLAQQALFAPEPWGSAARQQLAIEEAREKRHQEAAERRDE